TWNAVKTSQKLLNSNLDQFDYHNGKIEQRINQITPFLKVEERSSVPDVADEKASEAEYSSQFTKRLEDMDRYLRKLQTYKNHELGTGLAVRLGLLDGVTDQVSGR
ncbi:hypothetical protein MJO29_016495, partial [Puccinia striiformis f. sp. tritici]